MTTRWAYEAIAVEQFRSNKYMKPYFETDMMISRYDWQSAYLVNELKRKSNEAVYTAGKAEYEDIYRNSLEKLRTHIGELSAETGLDPAQAMRVINREPFTQDASYIVNDYLDSLYKNIRRKYIYQTNVKDSITRVLVAKMGKEELLKLRTETYNNDLAEIVLNRTVQKKFYETEHRIIQKADPVLMMPDSRIGRAHFYAPYKMLGKLRIGTLWFNMSVIWFLNTILFVTLYLNVLKLLLNLLERIKIPGFGSDRLVPPWEMIK